MKRVAFVPLEKGSFSHKNRFFKPYKENFIEGIQRVDIRQAFRTTDQRSLTNQDQG